MLTDIKNLLTIPPVDFSLRQYTIPCPYPHLFPSYKTAQDRYTLYCANPTDNEALRSYGHTLIYLCKTLSLAIKEEKTRCDTIFLDVIALDRTIISLFSTLSGHQQELAVAHHRLASNLNVLVTRLTFVKREAYATVVPYIEHALVNIQAAMEHQPSSPIHADYYEKLIRQHIQALIQLMTPITDANIEEAIHIAQRIAAYTESPIIRKDVVKKAENIYQEIAVFYSRKCHGKNNTTPERLSYAENITKQLYYWRKALAMSNKTNDMVSGTYLTTCLTQNIGFALPKFQRYRRWFEQEQQWSASIACQHAIIACLHLPAEQAIEVDHYQGISHCYFQLYTTSMLHEEKQAYARKAVEYAEKAHRLCPDNPSHALQYATALEAAATVIKKDITLRETAIRYYNAAIDVLVPLLKIRITLSPFQYNVHQILFFCYRHLFFIYQQHIDEKATDNDRIDNNIQLYLLSLQAGVYSHSLTHNMTDTRLLALQITLNDYLDRYYQLIVYLEEKGRYPLAESYVIDYIATSERENNAAHCVKGYSKQGHLFYAQQHYEKAIPPFLHALTLIPQPENIAIINALAICYKKIATSLATEAPDRNGFLQHAATLFKQQQEWQEHADVCFLIATHETHAPRAIPLFAEAIQSFMQAITQEFVSADITQVLSPSVAKQLQTAKRLLQSENTETAIRIFNNIIAEIKIFIKTTSAYQPPFFTQLAKKRRVALRHAASHFHESACQLISDAIKGFISFANAHAIVLLPDHFHPLHVVTSFDHYPASEEKSSALAELAYDIEKKIAQHIEHASLSTQRQPPSVAVVTASGSVTNPAGFFSNMTETVDTTEKIILAENRGLEAPVFKRQRSSSP